MFKSINPSVGDFDDLVENDKGCLSKLADDDPGKKIPEETPIRRGSQRLWYTLQLPSTSVHTADSILLNLLSAPSQPRQPKITPTLLDTLESRQIHTAIISPSPRAVSNIPHILLARPDLEPRRLDTLLDMISNISRRISHLCQTEPRNLHHPAHLPFRSVDAPRDFAESFCQGLGFAF